jgi:hypothetical protein
MENALNETKNGKFANSETRCVKLAFCSSIFFLLVDGLVLGSDKKSLIDHGEASFCDVRLRARTDLGNN